MKRRLFTLFTALLMLFALTACRGTDESRNPMPPVNDSSYTADGDGDVVDTADKTTNKTTANTGKKSAANRTTTTTSKTRNNTGSKSTTKTTTTTKSRSGSSFTDDMGRAMDNAGRAMGDLADDAMDAVDNAMDSVGNAMNGRTENGTIIGSSQWAQEQRMDNGTMTVPNYRSPA